MLANSLLGEKWFWTWCLEEARYHIMDLKIHVGSSTLRRLK
jgi:hypothetical protein